MGCFTFMQIKAKYKFSFLVTKYKENGAWILYNWKTTENITIEDPAYPLYKILDNQELWFGTFEVNGSYDDFSYLVDNDFVVENDIETIKYVEHQYNKSNSRENLELILMPVNQRCNFDCVYCYEDHNQKEKMGDSEREAIFSLIKKISNISSLGIDYFGGEPLLNHKFIEEFNALVITHCEENSINFTSSMTTNGYLLTKQIFEKLLSVKVTNYQITLDGGENSHNKLRPLSNGKGTFKKIYANLLDISTIPKSENFLIIIRVNYNPENSKASEINDFFDQIRNDFGNDARFVINPHPIMNWGGREKPIEFYPTKVEMSTSDRAFKDAMSSRRLRHFNPVNYSGIESNVCYAGKSNSLVVFPVSCSKTGDYLPLQKCTVGLFEEKNNVGRINLDGTIQITKNIDHWISNSPFKKDSCRECFFVLNCYGSSCPLNTINNGFVKCPEEKSKEIETVKEIMKYISDFST